MDKWTIYLRICTSHWIELLQSQAVEPGSNSYRWSLTKLLSFCYFIYCMSISHLHHYLFLLICLYYHNRMIAMFLRSILSMIILSLWPCRVNPTISNTLKILYQYYTDLLSGQQKSLFRLLDQLSQLPRGYQKSVMNLYKLEIQVSTIQMILRGTYMGAKYRRT